MRALIFLIVASNIFNVLDVITTVYAVKVLGYVEANVLMRKIINSSVECYAVIKILGLLAVSIIAVKTMYVCGKLSYRLYLLAFLFVLCVLCLAVVNNVYQILRVK